MINPLIVGVCAAALLVGAGGGGGPPSYTYDYANTYGSGDRKHQVRILGSATFSGSTEGMVDGLTTNVCFMSNGQSGVNIVFDFGEPRVIIEATWKQNTTTTHGTWKWQGSNDNTSYTDIGGTFTLGGTAQVHTELSGNTTEYRYYRLQQTAGTTSGTPYITEVEFKIDDRTTTYLWDTGDRTAPYALTHGGGITGTIENWVNGAQDNSWYFTGTLQQIKIDFGTAKKLRRVVAYQQNATSHGTFKWQGSNDDSTYTDIGSTFTFGGAAKAYYNVDSPTAYRYYKLVNTAGSPSSGPWQYEAYFEFEQ